MSLSDTITAALNASQSVIAQLGGAAAGVDNTRIVDTNETCIGNYGPAVVVNIPQASGGYRQRAQVSLVISQTEITAPPAAKSRVVRLDVTPPVTYIVDYVNTHGNLTYDLTLVRFGL